MPRVKAGEKGYGGKRRGKTTLRRNALITLGVFLLSVGLVAVWNSGWPQRQMTRAGNAVLALTASAGFSLQDVAIEGRDHTTREELLTALQVKRGMPTLALDRQEMAARLQQLPWLAGASIERHLPGTLYVRLTERTPLARWQFRNQVQLIDGAGKVIGGAEIKAFAHLPLVVGAGAQDRAAALLRELAAYPQVQQAMRAAVCVGERRWDLQLEPGVTVRLPEGKESYGLRRLNNLLNGPEILSREVQAVDLRFPDRVIIERPQGGAEAKTAKGVLKR